MASSRITIIAGLITAFFLGGLVLLCLAILGYFAGPVIEGRYFPILKAEHLADSVQRSDHLICWDTWMTKLRVGNPAYFEYFIERAVIVPVGNEGTRIDYETIPTAPFNVGPDGKRRYLSKRGFNEDHKPGQRWTSHYCIELPKDIDDTDGFNLRGDGKYDVAHGLWLVPQILPSFRVTEGITDKGRELDPSRLPAVQQ